MPMGLGLGVGLGGGAIPPAGAANPNLLLWSEVLDNPAWVATNCVVSPDIDGTADEMATTGAGASLAQVTSTAATTGVDATATVNPGVTFVRYSVSGVFDGLDYTLSAEIKDGGFAAVPAVRLRIARSGGFLKPGFEDPAADGDYLIRNVQLEQAAAFTTYHSRTT